MRLNLQTDYALRLLTYLAINDGSLCTITDVAARYKISKNHLMKVAHVLGREGIIDAVRGRTGGLKLAKPPAQIIVGDVVRTIETDFAIVECFREDGGECLISPACRLKNALSEAINAFLDVLDRYTIADLTHRNIQLQHIILLEAV